MPQKYLKKILTARVYDVAIESPLEPARSLSRRVAKWQNAESWQSGRMRRF